MPSFPPPPGTFFRKCSSQRIFDAITLLPQAVAQAGGVYRAAAALVAQGAATCFSVAGPGAFRPGLWCHHEERSDEGSALPFLSLT